MTSRLCKCGCGQLLERHKGESAAEYGVRQYAESSHYYRAVRKNPTKTCPQCGKRFGRKRKKGGRLESTFRFGQRITCSIACYAAARRGNGQHERIKQSPQRPPIQPRTASKPKKVSLPTPKRSDAPTAPVVNRPLPDPRSASRFEITAHISNRPACPKHPHVTLTTFGCSNCQVENRTQNRNSKPVLNTPVWRRNAV